MFRNVARSLRVGGVVVLAALLVVIAGLAAASPPDPTWIAGLYDDGDHDDAILLLLGLDAFLVTITLSAQPAGVVVPVVIADLTSAPTLCVEAVRSRAPPLPSPA